MLEKWVDAWMVGQKKSGYVRKMVGRWEGTISGTRHMISEEGGMVWLWHMLG